MARQATRITGYGLSDALPNIFPAPIVSLRSPGPNDTGYQIGQDWVNQSGGTSAFKLTKVAAGIATWLQETTTGGSGNFTTLNSSDVFELDTAVAGANTLGNLNGSTSITSLVGTSGFIVQGVASSPITLGTGITTGNISAGADQTSGTLILGSTVAGTGSILIGSGTGAQSILLGASGTGQKTIQLGATGSVDLIGIGSTTGASSLTLQAGTGAIALNAAGAVSMAPATVSAAAYAAVLNSRVGAVVLTGQTLASTTTQVITITNSLVTTASQIFVTVGNLGTNDAQLTMTRVQAQAGSFLVTIINNGLAALNGDIHITFWCIN